MAIHTRNGKVYLYRNVRQGGRVRRVYLGAGELAEYADALIRLQRAERFYGVPRSIRPLGCSTLVVCPARVGGICTIGDDWLRCFHGVRKEASHDLYPLAVQACHGPVARHPGRLHQACPCRPRSFRRGTAPTDAPCRSLCKTEALARGSEKGPPGGTMTPTANKRKRKPTIAETREEMARSGDLDGLWHL